VENFIGRVKGLYQHRKAEYLFARNKNKYFKGEKGKDD